MTFSKPETLVARSIVVHDYCGHPFTVELSRTLAMRGYRVHHVFFTGEGGPKGRNARIDGDPPTLSVIPVTIPEEYSKTNLLKRRKADVAYGARVAELLRDLRPDIVLSGNTPTEAQERILKATHDVGAKFLFWCQDIYSVAVSRILSRKLPGLGHLVGAWYTFLERRQMRRADHVVHITDGFLKVTDAWGIARDKVSVIPNWGVIDEIPLLPRDTAWAAETGLTRPARAVYSGTMALKHNPEFLERLAERAPEADVVVVGFGVGAERLARRAATLGNLHVLPLQPFARFPEVLASADVLVAVIEADAGEFSVPSKVLSYLCAGRPIVLAAPADNLAARMVTEAGAGIVVAPDDLDGFVAAVTALFADPARRAAMGAAGRASAERQFDLDRVCTVFESLFDKVMPPAGAAAPTVAQNTGG